MKWKLFSVLFVVIVETSAGNAAAPTISVLSQLKFDSDVLAVLVVSNVDEQGSVFLPLSPLHDRGHIIYDRRLEVLEGAKWHLVGRGSDAPSHGLKELRPGEKFIDFFQLPTLGRAAALIGLPKRLVIPDTTGGSRWAVRTKEFREAELQPTPDHYLVETLFYVGSGEGESGWLLLIQTYPAWGCLCHSLTMILRGNTTRK